MTTSVILWGENPSYMTPYEQALCDNGSIYLFVTGEKSDFFLSRWTELQSWNYEKWSELCCINVTIVIKKKPFATAMKGGGGGGNSKISSNQMMSQ